ncbi:hypothetical protein VTO73DRAFT_9558 [Trametes versicolor]
MSHTDSSARAPSSPIYHRIRPDFTIPREVQTPDPFRDEFCTIGDSPLPYAGIHTRRDVDEKGVFKGVQIIQVHGIRTDTTKRKDPRAIGVAWLKLTQYYDLVYHRLKQHWVISCVALIATIVGCSLGIGWAFRLRTFNIADPDNMSDSMVQLSANIVNVDPLEQKMTLDWVINYNCEAIGCPDVNIYFDSNTLRTDSGSSQTPSNTKPDPVFTVNGGNVLTMRNNTDRRPSSLTFRTDVAISNAHTHRTLQSYPYDKYDTELVFFAEEAITNNSVSIAIVKTTGIAVGFSIQLHDTTDDRDNFGTVIKNIEITRGTAVRLYAISIVLAIWLVTLTFMATCVVNVFFGKGISAGVLVLPIGTLFAFTQLRATLPGAPEGFGAVIDFMGLLPCLALLTFCSVFMTAIFLHRNPEHDAPRWRRITHGKRARSNSFPA